MKFLKNTAVAAAVLSMVTAPVAASAQNSDFDGLRADSELQDPMALAGGGWLLALLALAAVIAGAAVASQGSSNAPTSP